MTDSQSHQIEVMCARPPASPRWRPDPEIAWHDNRYPRNKFGTFVKGTFVERHRLGCVLLRRNAINKLAMLEVVKIHLHVLYNNCM